MTCVAQQKFCIIRGDTWQSNIGLGAGFDEVAAAPADYLGRLVIRLEQDDDLPEIAAQSVSVEPTGDALPAPIAYMHFELSPAETQALPPYDLAYFVELRKITTPTANNRLFEGRIEIKD